MICEDLEEYVIERGTECDETLYRYVTSVTPEVKYETKCHQYDWITVRSPVSSSQRNELEKELKPDGVLYVIE
jgi:hypothetical protein